MTQRVRITVEGSVHTDNLGQAQVPVVGNTMPHGWWMSHDMIVTAVEQITPPLTAEEALAEIEAQLDPEATVPSILSTNEVRNLRLHRIRKIIARTKQPEPSEQEALRDNLDVVKAELDAAYEALREIDGWMRQRTVPWDVVAVEQRRLIRERIAKVPGIGGDGE